MSFLSKQELLEHVDLHEESNFYTHHIDCDGGVKDHTKRLWIKVERGKIVGYCHNCGAYRVVRDNNRYKNKKKLDKSYIFNGLPKDFTVEIPPVYKVWLYKYRIYDDIIAKFGIGWSDHYHRIILPYYHEKDCVLWQGRAALPGQSPKYLTYKDKSFEMFEVNQYKSDSVVLVEDIASCIRVSETSNVIALLGTKLSSSARDIILSKYNHIKIWLDRDRAGMLGILKLKKQLQTVSNKVDVIFSDEDPKCYSHEEIKDKVNV